MLHLYAPLTSCFVLQLLSLFYLTSSVLVNSTVDLELCSAAINFLLQGKESNKVNNGESSGIIPNERMEPAAVVLSPSPEGNVTALEHPLSDQTNEHDENEAEVMNYMRLIRIWSSKIRLRLRLREKMPCCHFF